MTNQRVTHQMNIEQAMQLAISESQKGWGHTYHNPMVGCVILDSDHKLLATGYHAKWGGPHAEVDAVQKLKPEQLKDATVVVTLEPCAHEGKTPSCAKMLAKLPIKKLVYGLKDPNPLVSGAGAEIVRKAGIEVYLFEDYQKKISSPHVSALKSQLEESCEAFLYNMKTQLPFVAIKAASSLDGQIALQNGESKWITSEASREHVHYLRAGYDALLVGVNTVIQDNPSLNIRHPQFVGKENHVIVIDPQAKLAGQLSQLQITKIRQPNMIIWVTDSVVSSKEFESNVSMSGVTHLKARFEGAQLVWEDLFKQLFALKIKSIFIEGGAFTVSSILQKPELVGRLYLFLAPILMGNGLGWTQNLHIPSMNHKITLQNLQVSQISQDLCISAKLAK